MAVADQAREHQISSVPSEIYRDPVWVSRRPIRLRPSEDLSFGAQLEV
jgi:hypothetical protein